MHVRETATTDQYHAYMPHQTPTGGWILRITSSELWELPDATVLHDLQGRAVRVATLRGVALPVTFALYDGAISHHVTGYGLPLEAKPASTGPYLELRRAR